MDLAAYNGKSPQERRFPRAMLKIKFWFGATRPSRDSDAIACEDDNTTKSRTEKILRSFKRTFRRSGGRYRDSQLFQEAAAQSYHPEEVPMSINTHQELQDSSHSARDARNFDEVPPVPPPRNLGGPPVPPPRKLHGVEEAIKLPQVGRLVQEHVNLAKYGWYWGPLSKREAQEHLEREPDGSFLVRDSSSQNHIYTLSVRSYSYTLHTYIEYMNGTFKLGSLERASVPELINDALELSAGSILSYAVHDPPTPIRLLKPISRNMEVRSLMHLCRFVVRQHCNVNAIEELPLPATLKQYLLQGQY